MSKNKGIKKPSEKEINDEFQREIVKIEDTDISDFETIFNAGIDFIVNYNNNKNLLKTYTQLGFDVDLKEIIRRLSDDEDEDFDELYGVHIIEVTDVKFNQDNASVREMTIIFSAEESRGPLYTDLSIKINSHGIVNINIYDTPWEGGGVEDEMIKIIMKYCAQQKYL